MIINYYFKLRLKQLSRILKEIGFVRSLFLSGFLALAFYLVLKTSQSRIVPAATILGLIFYHNERKDKDFLLLQTKDAIYLLRIEYLLIGLPFVIIECLKTYFLEAGAIVATAILLPQLKTIKWKSTAVPLPFLYKGGLEYIRMFRLYSWLYFLLLLVAFMGALHGNIRIAKVSLMIWGIIQTVAFTSIPQRQELTSFLNYSTFQKYLVRSNAWNATVTSIPLIVIILSYSFVWENVLFSACALVGSVLYLWNLGMTRHLFSSTVTITIYQLIALIPLFFYACFIPFLLILFVLINGAYYLFIKNYSKKIWN